MRTRIRLRPRMMFLTALGCLALGASAAHAQEPVQVAVWDPVQIVPDTHSITGFRFSFLYGENSRVAGVDIAPLAARTNGDQIGLQIAMVGDVKGNMHGWQGGGVAVVEGRMNGVQHGLLYNEATEVRGVQISLINRTERMKGMQFGLLNFNEAGPLPFAPIVNWNF